MVEITNQTTLFTRDFTFFQEDFTFFKGDFTFLLEILLFFKKILLFFQEDFTFFKEDYITLQHYLAGRHVCAFSDSIEPKKFSVFCFVGNAVALPFCASADLVEQTSP